MITIASLNQQFIISLFIILIGFLTRRFGLFKEEDKATFSKVLFNITLPALIIKSLQTDLDMAALNMLIYGFGFGIFMILLSLFIGRRKERTERGLYAMTIPGFNVGLFAFPLVEAIWGIPALTYVIMFDMGNAYIIFGACYFFAKYFKEDKAKLNMSVMFGSLLRSTPFVTYNIALLLNLAGFRIQGLPLDFLSTLGDANTPLAFLLLGMSISPLFDKDNLRVLRNILLSRYIAGIAVGVFLYLITPVHPILSPLLLILFLLPLSMSTLPFSIQLGYDINFVGMVNSITIVISYFVIWVVAASVYG